MKLTDIDLNDKTEVAAAHALNFWPEVIDDSYIVFRYARNFLRGDGYAFNAGALLGGDDLENLAGLALVGAGNDDHDVVLLDVKLLGHVRGPPGRAK